MSNPVRQNKNGGFYRSGIPYSIERKTEVASVYWQMKVEGRKISERSLAAEAKTTRKIAKKIIEEIESMGQLIDPDTMQQDRARGCGSMTLSFEDEILLLRIRQHNPQTTLTTYCRYSENLKIRICLGLHH